jgi:hypothetical protein
MTPQEARQLIGLEGRFTPEELEAAARRRFQELESKIQRAPTPGLKDKYRRTLVQLEEAWEVLSGTKASPESQNFPTLQPIVTEEPAGSIDPVAFEKAPISQRQGGARAPRGIRLYLVVAAIVGLVLIVGGLGYYYGVVVPAEQARQVEIAKQEAIQKEKEDEANAAADAAEKARLNAEAQKAEAAAEALRTEHEKQREEAERLANARGGLLVKTYPPGGTVTLGGEDEQTSPASFKSIKLGS